MLVVEFAVSVGSVSVAVLALEFSISMVVNEDEHVAAAVGERVVVVPAVVAIVGVAVVAAAVEAVVVATAEVAAGVVAVPVLSGAAQLLGVPAVVVVVAPAAVGVLELAGVQVAAVAPIVVATRVAPACLE